MQRALVTYGGHLLIAECGVRISYRVVESPSDDEGISHSQLGWHGGMTYHRWHSDNWMIDAGVDGLWRMQTGQHGVHRQIAGAWYGLEYRNRIGWKAVDHDVVGITQPHFLQAGV